MVERICNTLSKLIHLDSLAYFAEASDPDFTVSVSKNGNNIKIRVDLKKSVIEN